MPKSVALLFYLFLVFVFQICSALTEAECLALSGAENAFQLDSKHVDLDKLIKCIRYMDFELMLKTKK